MPGTSEARRSTDSASVPRASWRLRTAAVNSQPTSAVGRACSQRSKRCNSASTAPQPAGQPRRRSRRRRLLQRPDPPGWEGGQPAEEGDRVGMARGEHARAPARQRPAQPAVRRAARRRRRARLGRRGAHRARRAPVRPRRRVGHAVLSAAHVREARAHLRRAHVGGRHRAALVQGAPRPRARLRPPARRARVRTAARRGGGRRRVAAFVGARRARARARERCLGCIFSGNSCY